MAENKQQEKQITIFRYNEETEIYKKIVLKRDGTLTITEGKKGEKNTIKSITVKLTMEELAYLKEVINLILIKEINEKLK
ncbi:MAG: hypothetical protein ACO2O6_06425 [Candidatus Hydrothermia bacterium]|jgi:hypothetical protein